MRSVLASAALSGNFILHKPSRIGASYSALFIRIMREKRGFAQQTIASKIFIQPQFGSDDRIGNMNGFSTKKNYQAPVAGDLQLSSGRRFDTDCSKTSTRRKGMAL